VEWERNETERLLKQGIDINVDEVIDIIKISVVYEEKEITIANDIQGRTKIKFTGFCYMDKPVSQTYVILSYFINGDNYIEEGCFNENFQLSGIGLRIKFDGLTNIT